MRIRSGLLAAAVAGATLWTATGAIADEAIDQRGSISVEGPTILEGMSLTVTVNGERYEKSAVDEMVRGPFTVEWAVVQAPPHAALGSCPEGDSGASLTAGGSTPAAAVRATPGSSSEGPIASPEISEQRPSVVLAACPEGEPDPGTPGPEPGETGDDPEGPPADRGKPKKAKPHPSKGDEQKDAASKGEKKPS